MARTDENPGKPGMLDFPRPLTTVDVVIFAIGETRSTSCWCSARPAEGDRFRGRGRCREVSWTSNATRPSRTARSQAQGEDRRGGSLSRAARQLGQRRPRSARLVGDARLFRADAGEVVCSSGANAADARWFADPRGGRGTKARIRPRRDPGGRGRSACAARSNTRRCRPI